MSSQVDQKRAFNKLKHDLEPWRNVIVHVDDLLSWKKNFYPAITVGAVSFFYLILWAMDMSTITTLAFAGILFLGLDYGYPMISRFLFNQDKWAVNHETQFENVCSQLLSVKMALQRWYEYVFSNEEPKSALFHIVVCVALFGLAWIGAVINNFFLMYLITLGALMYPGIRKKDVFKLLKQQIGCLNKVNKED